MGSGERIFTPRFFVMCGFTFTVFASVFLMLPTMPYRILALQGSERAAGAFLGVLTYASALSAPFTGALADRAGKRRILVGSSLVIAVFSVGYAFTTSVPVLLTMAAVHGVFWSALLGASSAYMVDIIPAHRRAEGIGYWGLATIFAIAVAPGLGFRLFHVSWTLVCGTVVGLNLAMAAIAWHLRHERPAASGPRPGVIEWHVLLLSGCLFLYSFGYGAITSFVALHADAFSIRPRSLFFTVFAVVIVATRPLSGPLADRIGHRKVFVPCLGLIAAGLALLGLARTPWSLAAAAIVFGSGFGTAWPVFAAYVMEQVGDSRRGAAFGSMLASFDTGIGTGSILAGWIVERHGYPATWFTAAALACLAAPWFLFFERGVRSGGSGLLSRVYGKP
jgi:MFS family permease